jgi:truncated hemoglobin YjbI
MGWMDLFLKKHFFILLVINVIFGGLAMTLFDKYGGVPTVTSIVRAFYKEVLKNYKLKPYFENIDTERLIHHQIGFISHLLGKPASIHVEQVLSHSHKGRRISEDAFDEVMFLLGDVLTAHKMEPDDIKAVADLVISYKGEIVEIQNSVRVHKT